LAGIRSGGLGRHELERPALVAAALATVLDQVDSAGAHRLVGTRGADRVGPEDRAAMEGLEVPGRELLGLLVLALLVLAVGAELLQRDEFVPVVVDADGGLLVVVQPDPNLVLASADELAVRVADEPAGDRAGLLEPELGLEVLLIVVEGDLLGGQVLLGHGVLQRG